MRKRELRISIMVLLSLVVFLHSAASQGMDNINRALACLDNRVNSTALSLHEAVFAALAKVPNTKANTTITNMKHQSETCWPSSGCTIKETAHVALAKREMNQNTTEIIEWLISKSGATTGLTWYLQITISNNEPAVCIVSYDDFNSNVQIDENMTLSGNAGSCLEFANSKYWLKVKQNCVDREFRVSCDKLFLTNLLYEKETGGTIFVSSRTNSAAANGITREKITASCFKQSGVCDYEASLWATSALYAAGADTAEYAPYLRALAPENQQYLPSAFLYHILQETSMSNEQYEELLSYKELDILGGLWRVPGTPFNTYYDTSLAMLALGGANVPEVSQYTIPSLFEVQTAEGCFNNNNIRDTAFIIYAAGWLRTGFGSASGGSGTGGTETGDAGAVCGNGVIEGNEVCETNPMSLNNKNCSSLGLGYTGGNLSCTVNCMFNVSECTGAGPQVPPGVNPGGVVDILPNSCFQGNWYEQIGSPIDTTQVRGYCHRANSTAWPNGCCPANYRCAFSGGNESDSICVLISGGGGVYDPGAETNCEAAGHYCVPDIYSCIVAGGNALRDLNCHNFAEACCSVPVLEPEDCASKGGFLCAFNEDCTGSIAQTSDGVCCLDTCAPVEGVRGNGGSADECTVDANCSSDKTCSSGSCVAKPQEEGSLLWFWIVLLLIFIVLAVLGIIYKDRIRLWWFKRRGKVKTGRVGPPPSQPGILPGVRRAPPRFEPTPVGVKTMPRSMIPSSPARLAEKPPAVAQRKPTNEKDKEMEETLKKLREMS